MTLSRCQGAAVANLSAVHVISLQLQIRKNMSGHMSASHATLINYVRSIGNIKKMHYE